MALILAAAAMTTLNAASRTRAAQWGAQVMQVDAGALKIAPEFKIAIYENLLEELARSREFSTVLRSGDQRAGAVPHLLILKTTIEAYTPGSETKRAVTTFSGATKLKVRTQLCTPQGQVVLERVIDGKVRFFGGNLRATHNLARNVVTAIQQANLPPPSAPQR